MKPFDPKTAKNGDTLTWKKHNLKEFCTYVGPFPTDKDYSVILDEKGHLGFTNNDYLFIKPTKRTVWINVYQGSQCYRFNNKETALAFPLDKDYIGTYPLEIEE